MVYKTVKLWTNILYVCHNRLHGATTNDIKLSHSCEAKSLSYSRNSCMVQYQCTKPKLIYGDWTQCNETASIKTNTLHITDRKPTPSKVKLLPFSLLMLKSFPKVNFWNHQWVRHYTIFSSVVPCMKSITHTEPVLRKLRFHAWTALHWEELLQGAATCPSLYAPLNALLFWEAIDTSSATTQIALAQILSNLKVMGFTHGTSELLPQHQMFYHHTFFNVQGTAKGHKEPYMVTRNGVSAYILHGSSVQMLRHACRQFICVYPARQQLTSSTVESLRLCNLFLLADDDSKTVT
jgi:hypothetical protein